MTREDFIQKLPQLLQDYRTPRDALEHVAHIDLLMLVGATGVGKTSIIKRLGIPFVITDTTRPIRPWEINGSDYYFRTDYSQLASEIRDRLFVQTNIYSTGDFYGTRLSAYPALGFAVYSVVSDKVPEFRNLGFNETICAFVTPPSYEEWMKRLEGAVERDQLEKRLAEAKQSYNFALNDKDTHFILNDDLDQAVRQTIALLNGKCDQNLENKAHQAAQEIYQKLSAA